ncbi:MAG: Crp/Fnr family transcriptional regulator [Alcaligenaceae bacterium]|nr:Crp/Fnr family transcriptional regulator [Alcaligenaceae bacterium]
MSSVAYTDVRVCRASQADAIEQFGHTDSAQKFGLLLHKAMQELVRWVDIHRINGIPARAESALRHLTEQQGSRMVRIPEQAVFARLLGCSRETLARSLQYLEQQGRIRRAGRGHIEVNVPFYLGTETMAD